MCVYWFVVVLCVCTFCCYMLRFVISSRWRYVLSLCLFLFSSVCVVVSSVLLCLCLLCSRVCVVLLFVCLFVFFVI